MLTRVQSHFEDAQLEPSQAAYRELSMSEASADSHLYEEIVAAVTSSKAVIKEKNPAAYESTESQLYECVVGVTNSVGVMEENPIC